MTRARDQVEAQTYLRRRLVAAFVTAAQEGQESVTPGARRLLAGVVLAAGLVGAARLGAPLGPLGSAGHAGSTHPVVARVAPAGAVPRRDRELTEALG